MKIIDRYIIKELIPPFLMGLFVFTFAMLFNYFILFAELMINVGIRFTRIAEMLYYSLPNILVLTIPIGFLIAVLMTFGRLSADNEITALKANGVSVMRLTVPVLILAVLCWGVTQYIFIELQPQSLYELNRIKSKIKSARISKILQPHIFTELGKLVFYADEILQSGLMKRLFIYDDGEGERDPFSAFATEGYQIQGASNLTLKLINGVIHSVPLGGSNKYIVDSFEYHTISIEEQEEETDTKANRIYTIAELKQIMAERRATGQSTGKYQVMLHQKFSIPFACLVFALIGVPLGITSKRGGKATGFAIALALIIIYYIFLEGGEAMGTKGVVRPWFGMWAPNIFLGLFGIYLLIKLVRESRYRLIGGIMKAIYAVLKAVYKTLVPKEEQPKLFPKTRSSIQPRKLSITLSFPKILDRYIMEEFLKYFIFIILTFVLISLITKAFEELKYFLRHEADLVVVFKYFGYLIPNFAFIAIQVAVLVATVLIINRFSKSFEMTAMMASGISLYRIAFPIILLAFLISCVSFVFNEYVIPNTNRKAEETMLRIKDKRQNKLVLQNATWRKGDKNQIYYYLAFDRKNNLIIDFTLFQLDSNGMPLQRFEAPRVKWELETPSGKEGIPDKGHWVMENGRIITFNPSNMADIQEQRFDRQPLPLDEHPSELKREQKKSSVMNYNELNSYIKMLRRSGYTTLELEVDLHSKISLPFISFIIAIVGIPFAVQTTRSGTMAGIGISIFIGFAYVIIFSVVKALGSANVLPPFFAAWAANFFFFITGLFMMTGAKT